MSFKKISQILKIKLKKSKIAIIDIGSNSVRLVIYPDSGKYPYPLFNERINCRLGEKIYKTNNLSVNSISRALKALQRFSIIIKKYLQKSNQLFNCLINNLIICKKVCQSVCLSVCLFV